MQRQLTIGILAHVDAGKTTLTEAMLWAAGLRKTPGRVDHGDAFLDTEAQEKSRGITIFSKVARLPFGESEFVLVDTPGHVDFGAEMERTLSVLDCGILVVSGRELVQSHTRTLWRLLQRRGIPAFIFVNKMDLEGTDPGRIMAALKKELSEGCVAFAAGEGSAELPADVLEELALCDEDLLQGFLEEGEIPEEKIRGAIRARRVFPCFFGSALKLQGVKEFMAGLDRWAPAEEYGQAFSARVYKITRDGKGKRMTHMKITGGRLAVRDVIGGRTGEKVSEIRLYSGEKYESVSEVGAGEVCAVAGLQETYAGQLLGGGEVPGLQARSAAFSQPAPGSAAGSPPAPGSAAETPPAQGSAAGSPPAPGSAAETPVLRPVLRYGLRLPEGLDAHRALRDLRQLEEEDPQLKLRWDEAGGQIQIALMGEIQKQVLARLIEDRFGYPVEFDEGRIEYRETIASPVRGAGHFEPLRHYAEVHLLLEPLACGAGIVCDSSCGSDELDTNWQRLITTHLTEREHPGPLTGSPLTDVRITIEGGRAHLKHTEGGDFRQATYRAIAQALRKGDPVLLEPWYDFILEVPRSLMGRVMNDVQAMGGSCVESSAAGAGFGSGLGSGPAGAGSAATGETVMLTGSAPVSEMRSYGARLGSISGGQGQLSCSFGGYRPCHNTEEVTAEIGYDPDADPDNVADSIFCSGGAGRKVPWNEADGMMHVEIRAERQSGADGAGAGAGGAAPGHETGAPAGGQGEGEVPGHNAGRVGAAASGRDAKEDRELDRIFERTYGKREQRIDRPARSIEGENETKVRIKSEPPREEHLLVDGYNIIFAWDELKELAAENIDSAREALLDILADYQGSRGGRLTVVFDAYKVKGGRRREEEHDNIAVIFTKEDETADTLIERMSYELGRTCRVRVATSDRLEQMIAHGSGALRVSATEFKAEVEEARAQIGRILEERRKGNERRYRRRISIPESGEAGG